MFYCDKIIIILLTCRGRGRRSVCVESVDANGTGLFNVIHSLAVVSDHFRSHFLGFCVCDFRSFFFGFRLKRCAVRIEQRLAVFLFSVDIILQCCRARVGLLNVLDSHIAERAERIERTRIVW